MPSNQNPNPNSRPNPVHVQRPRGARGFASMDPARQRQIASQGGRAAHEQGVAHEFSPEEARLAGRKGGESVSQDREHMAQIGRKGGESSGGGRARSGNGSTRHRGGTADQVESTSQPTGEIAGSPAPAQRSVALSPERQELGDASR